MKMQLRKQMKRARGMTIIEKSENKAGNTTLRA
jgi:hypothetical protein